MSKTLQKRFIEALQKRGETEVKRTSKYIVYTCTYGNFYYYLGRSGAIRVGKTSVSSFPLTKAAKEKLLEQVQ